MPISNNPIYIDTHFHIDKYKDHKEIYNYLNKEKMFTICVTNSPEEYVNCKNTYKETQYVKFGIGYNPNISKDIKFNSKIFNLIIDSSRIIGEIGLDFQNKDIQNNMYQIEILEQIFDICSEKDKIYNFHCRKAEKELYELIRLYKIDKFILHWFTGTEIELKKFIEIGAYFSINSNMVNNKGNFELLKMIPKNRILIESDGPYTSISNKKYNPKLLKDCYMEISNKLNISDLEDVVIKNIKTLF